MNILITRPLIDSEDLMGKLFSLGHKIVHIPTLKISAANISLVDAQKYDAFIFTSANAIRNLKLNNQDTIFIYSKRSAESFIEIVKKYSLNVLMTESRVLCISEKVLGVLKKTGWKKLEVFQPGEELEKLKD